MSEVLVEFDTVLTAQDGSRWVPRACGGVADDGLWEGWMEFLPMDDEQEAARSQRETEQPNRADLMYWAQGLTVVYLEGSLERALRAPLLPRRGRPHAPRARNDASGKRRPRD